MTFIEQNVPYMLVYLFIGPFNYPIFLLWVWYHRMVFDTRFLVKRRKQIVHELWPEVSDQLQRCRKSASMSLPCIGGYCVTFCLGNNSTYHEKVSMITIMYLNSISKGKGPIASIEIRPIGFNVESTNREVFIVLCWGSIFWQVE